MFVIFFFLSTKTLLMMSTVSLLLYFLLLIKTQLPAEARGVGNEIRWRKPQEKGVAVIYIKLAAISKRAQRQNFLKMALDG